MLNYCRQVVTLYGVPVRLHLSLLVVLFVFIASTGSPALGLALTLMLLLSVLLHELGHTYQVLRRGGRVRSIDLWMLGGMAIVDRPPPVIADELKVAIAGPLVSLSIAAFAALLRSGSSLPPTSYRMLILNWTVTLNLMLFGFNLLPAFPMDGGRVLRAFMARYIGMLPATYLATRLGKLLALIMGLMGLFRGWPFLLIIAIVVFVAAEQEMRAVRIRYMMGAAQWTDDANEVNDATPPPDPAPPPNEIRVGPPPYERSRNRRPKRWFPFWPF